MSVQSSPKSLLFWSDSYHNLPTSYSPSISHRAKSPTIQLARIPSLSHTPHHLHDPTYDLPTSPTFQFRDPVFRSLSSLSIFSISSSNASRQLELPRIPILVAGDATGSVFFLRVFHGEEDSDEGEEESPLGFAPVGWFRPPSWAPYERSEDISSWERQRRYRSKAFDPVLTREKEIGEFRDMELIRQIEVSEEPLQPQEEVFSVSQESDESLLVYALSRCMIRVWEFQETDPDASEADKARGKLLHDLREHVEDNAQRNLFAGGTPFVRRDRLRPVVTFLSENVSERFKRCARFVGPGSSEMRLAVCAEDRRLPDRHLLQVLDFSRALESAGSVRRRKRRDLIDVVWRREKDAGDEEASYEDLIAGSGIIGGHSTSRSVFAACGFGSPHSFRIGSSRKGGIVDVFDTRQRPSETPPIQIFSVMGVGIGSFSSLARVRTSSSGFGLLTASHFGRIQFWDLRMLKQSGRFQNRLDGSTPIGDWCIVNGLTDSMRVRNIEGERLDLRLPSSRKCPIDIFETPSEIQEDGELFLSKMGQEMCLVKEEGDDAVLVATANSILRWSGFGAFQSPKVEVLRSSDPPSLYRSLDPTSDIPRSISHFGSICPVSPPLRSFLASPTSVMVDPFLSTAEVLCSLLETVSDFHLRTPSGRIRCFRSLMMNSRHSEMILSKKFAKIRWDVESVSEDDLVKFLIGVKGCLSPSSLLDYYILFSELGMVSWMFFVCRDAECLNGTPEVVCRLLALCRDRLPRILESREASYEWTESPLVKALLNSLSNSNLEEDPVLTLLQFDEYGFIRPLLPDSFSSILRLKIFRRVRRLTPHQVMRKGFSKLAREPATGNVVLSFGSSSYRVHAETFVLKSEYFRGLFSFGGTRASLNSEFDVSETFQAEESLQTYIHYVYTDAIQPSSFECLLELAKFADFSSDDDLARAVIDAQLTQSRKWHEEDEELKVLMLEKGHLYREIGAEWIQREILAVWSMLLGSEEEVFRILGQSLKLAEEELGEE